jgi:hypothetical protein
MYSYARPNQFERYQHEFSKLKPHDGRTLSEPVVIAPIGISGAIIGSTAMILGSIVLHCMKEFAAAK